jgi:hypothetical protein
MKEKFLDLLYSTRNLTEVLRDRPELLERDDELIEILEEVEGHLDDWSSVDENEEELDI